jgi:glycosyltransferase involved in cell wall biosynthesis
MSAIKASSLPITVLIATRNEEANIQRCLHALAPAASIVVLDSGSTDRTAELARQHGASVILFTHRGGYPKKRQWALEHVPIQTPWILLLDADEVVPNTLWQEIADSVNSDSAADAYLIRKGFHFLGRKFRYGGFSHSAVLLFKTGKARFEKLIEVPGDSLDMEVHERLIVDGTIGELKTPLIHEDFKGLQSYIDKHNRYSTWEAFLRYAYLNAGTYGVDSVAPKLFGNSQERRRWLKLIAVRMPFEPWLWFFYHFIVKLGFLEGRAGKIACDIRKQYISDVRAKLFEIRQGPRSEP